MLKKVLFLVLMLIVSRQSISLETIPEQANYQHNYPLFDVVNIVGPVPLENSLDQELNVRIKVNTLNQLRNTVTAIFKENKDNWSKLENYYFNEVSFKLDNGIPFEYHINFSDSLNFNDLKIVRIVTHKSDGKKWFYTVWLESPTNPYSKTSFTFGPGNGEWVFSIENENLSASFGSIKTVSGFVEFDGILTTASLDGLQNDQVENSYNFHGAKSQKKSITKSDQS